VALGGALGSVARFLVTRALHPAPGGDAFPWGTLAVNLAGAFAISALLGHGGDGAGGAWLSPAARAALVTGVLGGFTTYSAFNHDALRLLHAGAPLTAALYLAATVGGCLAAGLAGGLLAARR
jgi:CrcB protein